MASPISRIDHTPRAIMRALNSTCWYVYWRAAATAADPTPQHFRVVTARRQQGHLQVRLLLTWKWQVVAPTDFLFQQ